MNPLPNFKRAFALTLFTVLVQGLVPAQRIASPAQLAPLRPPAAPMVLVDQAAEMPRAVPLSTAKTTSVGMPVIGRSGNAYSSAFAYRHSMFADDSLGVVGLVHRQDVTIWGGGAADNGKLRVDLSVDRGVSFVTDIGPLNPAYTKPSRHPQMVLQPPAPGSTPYDAKLLWSSMTLDALSDWDGLASGVCNVSPSPASISEHYLFGGEQYSPGSLCPGQPGEFWQIAEKIPVSPSGAEGNFYLFKGTYNASTADVDWALQDSIVPTYNLSYDGTPHVLNASIAFSPDGNTGWIAFPGDLAGGHDSVYSPILVKTTDGGDTWGPPVEVDLRSFGWIADTLQYLWVDSLGLPSGSGRPTLGFELDLTVDANGNPHLFAVIANGSPRDSLPGYDILTGLSMFGADITTPDGGVTWSVRMVAPMLTMRYEFWGGVAAAVTIWMENHLQVSRSEDGEYIYYLWVDSDTTEIGFGQSLNLEPNLLVSGYRVSDGHRTCNKCITCGGAAFEGKAYLPVLAPTCIQRLDSAGAPFWSLPCAVMEETIPGDELQPVVYHYAGDYATFNMGSDFLPESSYDLRHNTCYASPTGGTLFPAASGTIWYDLDGDGLLDPGEPPANYRVVMNTLGNATLSGLAGGYVLPSLPGTFDVYLPPVPGFTQTHPVSPPTYPLSFSTGDPPTPGLDFGLQPDSLYYDMAVAATCGPIITGRDTRADLWVSNRGTVPDSGWVTLVHPPGLTLTATDPPYTTYSALTRTISWWSGHMAPFVFGEMFSAEFLADTTLVAGTAMDFEASVTSSGADADTSNNRFGWSEIVLSSYDPNDKNVSVDTLFSDLDQRFVYTIRFQNTGTAPAHAVRIRDTLDTDLDLGTFRFIGSSHNCSVSMTGPGYLTFNHPGIVLPDSGADLAGSNGYLMYEIRPRAGLSLGTAIHNTAAIYFDYNPPVITNTTHNIYALVSVDPGMADQLQVIAYPVPAEREVTFSVENWNGQPWKLVVMDLQGAVVKEMEVHQQASVLDCTGMGNGIYLWRIKAGGAMATGKLSVMN